MRHSRFSYSEHPSHASRAAHARGEREFKTYDTSAIRPKRSKAPAIAALIIILCVIIGVICGIVFGLQSCSASNHKLLETGKEAQISVANGSSLSQVGNQLYDAGIISSVSDFTAQGASLETSLAPGQYTFVGGMKLEEVIQVFLNGPTVRTVTIPEGMTATQVAQTVAAAYENRITAEDFMAQVNNASAYVNDYPFVAGAYNNSLEGFLFPKTYQIEEGATADSVVRQMLSQYQTEVASLDYTTAQAHGLSPYQTLILASIIEKEATADNRATVSSVFYNRLDIGMPLQSDATVAYVIGDDPRPEDLQIESPYNTYLNNGLPAGPICSPGLSCLEAACTPEATDYLYFYFAANDAGEMQYYFSHDYDQHQEAIATS